MSIPKHVHWGLFGLGRLTWLNIQCMASWERVLSDYQLVGWNDATVPNKTWVRRALRESPINAHNYMGLWALYRMGGVMMDNDVEVIRPFDLNQQAFFAWQRKDGGEPSIGNAVMGAVEGHPLIRAVMDEIELHRPGHDPVIIGCGILSDKLRQLGMRGMNIEQKVGEVKIYDRERFYPYWWDEPVIPNEKLGERTFAVHRWQGSWRSK